ncbi:hypothetical protein PHLCEN_2v8182 [Hermanssonia centrifuga]|uniref:Beta-lactamase-related domain-containing protein n=1 Tax=Hermanssonia centrifuga TaxID=98765 RepID=A0A2R6NUC2_9APHY|nr:hypothetical protein PHLCEN_2v8182 [Hermanssonia centrifuga]
MGLLMDDFAHGKNKTALPSPVTQFDWDTKIAELLPDDWKLMDEWASSEANMYIVGSHIVSTYAGMPYMDFVKARIWEPLDMSETTFHADEASQDGKLTQTWTKFGRRIPIWFPEEQLPLHAGPGGVISNVIDMAKWVAMLLNSGTNPVTNETILPMSVLTEVTSAHTIVHARAPSPEFSISGYGMGWFRESYQGHELISHSGGIPGISTEVCFLPSERLGVVILSNADNKHSSELAIIYRIIEDFLGLDRKASVEYMSTTSSQPLSGKPLPQESMSPRPLTLPLNDYAGTYVSPGYPNITLCASSSSTEDCEDVINDFKSFDDVSSSPMLYARLPNSISISHVRLRQKHGDSFALSATNLFPHGYGLDESPFETWDPTSQEATAEFVVEEADISNKSPRRVLGLGLMDLSGELTERRRLNSVEQRSEVWFTKL